VVLWYVFGAHHVARPEDWPVMPVSTIGFMLKPSGFFDGNPALDLPAPSHCHHDWGAFRTPTRSVARRFRPGRIRRGAVTAIACRASTVGWPRDDDL
jgi:hypothetical protein